MEISIKWNMCRTCTCRRTSDLQPLFNDEKIAQKLREYAGVIVEKNDGLPDKICAVCINALQVTHQFLSKCKKSDEHLKTVVNHAMSTRNCFSILTSPDFEDDEGEVYDAAVGKSATRTRKQALSDRQVDVKYRRIKIMPRSESIIAKNEPKEEVVLDQVVVEETNVTDLVDATSAAESGHSKPGSETDADADTDASEIITIERYSSLSETLKKESKQKANNSDDYIIYVNEGAEKNVYTSASDENSDNDHTMADVDVVNENSSCKFEENNATTKNDDNAYILNAAQSAEEIIEEDDDELIYESGTNSETHMVDLGGACKPARFSCPVCANTFPKQSQLQYHLRLHSNEKNHECELCGKRFTATCNLTTHMRTHTGEKPYECGFCHRRFSDRSTVRKHERIHTNERPFKCGICHKAFSLASTLKAHEAVHSNAKPYRCVTCNKGFKLPHQLKAHENTHVHRCEAGMKYR
ncbi:zinc finger protein 391 [Scaptodrosophila lebanonensis]|uniref:Zinc finger protein 391 n=1 Tax=Drosophila lebanonensis TaxID=7225 RepID=A0A6J2TI98_DROLE|nr:zinc finger protein 391 [Scaptodrosophila lebanonensis]